MPNWGHSAEQENGSVLFSCFYLIKGIISNTTHLGFIMGHFLSFEVRLLVSMIFYLLSLNRYPLHILNLIFIQKIVNLVWVTSKVLAYCTFSAEIHTKQIGLQNYLLLYVKRILFVKTFLQELFNILLAVGAEWPTGDTLRNKKMNVFSFLFILFYKRHHVQCNTLRFFLQNHYVYCIKPNVQ